MKRGAYEHVVYAPRACSFLLRGLECGCTDRHLGGATSPGTRRKLALPDVIHGNLGELSFLDEVLVACAQGIHDPDGDVDAVTEVAASVGIEDLDDTRPAEAEAIRIWMPPLVV